MAGGFTKYNKLEVTDLGTEGTGDRIALFNSDGRLIGYVLKENLENFVPLSGTEVGKPITRDLEFGADGDIKKIFSETNDGEINNRFSVIINDSDVYANTGFLYEDLDNNTKTKILVNVNNINLISDKVGGGEVIIDFPSSSKGIKGIRQYDKQNDPNAFAQLGDVQDATGHASYTDTAYTVGSPLTLLAGVDTVLPNNSGVIYDDEKPDDITTFYNGTTITGRDGDGLAIMIYFKATPSTINSELDIWIDIGGGIGELYRQTVYFRGATKKGVLYTLPTAYTRATWESNGGTVYVKASVNMTVYGMNFNISRTHKSKN